MKGPWLCLVMQLGPIHLKGWKMLTNAHFPILFLFADFIFIFYLHWSWPFDASYAAIIGRDFGRDQYPNHLWTGSLGLNEVPGEYFHTYRTCLWQICLFIFYLFFYSKESEAKTQIYVMDVPVDPHAHYPLFHSVNLHFLCALCVESAPSNPDRMLNMWTWPMTVYILIVVDLVFFFCIPPHKL